MVIGLFYGFENLVIFGYVSVIKCENVVFDVLLIGLVEWFYFDLI